MAVDIKEVLDALQKATAEDKQAFAEAISPKIKADNLQVQLNLVADRFTRASDVVRKLVSSTQDAISQGQGVVVPTYDEIVKLVTETS